MNEAEALRRLSHYTPNGERSTPEDIVAFFEKKNKTFGRLLQFADSVSDALWGDECAWCNDDDKGEDGLENMRMRIHYILEELRKSKP